MFYHCFNLLMTRSPWLRVYVTQLTRPIKTRFPFGSRTSIP